MSRSYTCMASSGTALFIDALNTFVCVATSIKLLVKTEFKRM